MQNLIKLSVTSLVLTLSSFGANAAHSIYNPMAPRSISVEATNKDYSYGLSVLPGNSIDSVDPFFRYVGWVPNYYVFDRYILRPLAHGYAKLPDGVQSSVGNFFSNLDEINNIPNNLLIGEPESSCISLGRFTINSTAGILGFFDVASKLGLQSRPMSMDTVLGKAGVDQGMYMMIPIAGPYTERSLHATLIDNWPYYLWSNIWIDAALWAVEGVHNRAQLVSQEALVDNSVDPYAQTRQIFLMYAQGKVDPDATLKDNSVDEDVDSFLDEIDEQ